MISMNSLIESRVKSPKKRVDVRSLPSTDRGERKRHHKTPIFLRRCVVRMYHDRGMKNLDRCFATCYKVMSKAGYFKAGTQTLTAKGKQREREYKVQDDTPTQLDKFDAIMKQGRADRALKKAVNSSKIDGFSALISLYENKADLIIFVDEKGRPIPHYNEFGVVPMLRLLNDIGINGAPSVSDHKKGKLKGTSFVIGKKDQETIARNIGN